MKKRVVFVALLFGVLGQAHDIDADVKVQAYVRAEDGVLRVIARAPLAKVPDEGAGKAAWLASHIEAVEEGVELGKPKLAGERRSREGDKAFAAYGDALRHVREGAQEGLKDSGEGMGGSNGGDEAWGENASLDVLLEWQVRSGESRFEIEPQWGSMGKAVLTTLFYLPPGGSVRAFELLGNPGRVPLDPSLWQALWRFLVLGFFHILEGTDHLLFLLCLVIPFREFRPLLIVVTAFTVAHSVTLIASAMSVAPNVVWFPPLIETLIAASILYMALENIVVDMGGAGSLRRRWMVTFGFGLVHGFGFSFLLHETLQFAGSHLLTSLVAFNVGVEIGQIAVLLVTIPVLNLLFKYVVAERTGTIILCAFVAHTAWHWMIERWEALWG